MINQANNKLINSITKNFLNFFVIIGIFLFYSYSQTQPKTELEIQAYISGGNFMEVYFNEEWHRSFKLPIVKGNINSYKLVDVPPNLKSIRIDPTDLDKVEIEIFDVRLKGSENTIFISKEFPIQGWESSGIKCINQKCQSTSNDPILSQKLNVKLDNDLTYSIEQLLGNRTFQLLSIILLITFSILINNSLHKILLLSVIILLSNISFKLLLTHVPTLLQLKLPVNEVIGIASYNGLNIPNNIFYFNLILFSFVITYIVTRNFFKINLFDGVNNHYKFNLIDYFYSFLFGVVFFIIVSPHFWWLSGLNLGPYMSDFDSQNIVTWGYMVAKQYLPYRDFWYPYSLYAYLQPPVFPNDLFKSLHSLIIYLVIQYSLIKIYNGDIKKLIFTLVFYYCINLIYLPVGTDRYFISFSLLLFFYAYLQNPSVLSGVVFGVYVAYCSLFELNQVVYFLPSSMVILIGSYLSKSILNLQKLFLSIIIPVFVFVLITGLIITLAIEFDIFLGYVSLFRAMSKMYLYGLWPTDYSQWLLQLSNEGLWLLCILIIMAISIFGFKKTDFFSYLFLAFFLLQIVIFQKQLLRPHVAHELLIFPTMMLLIIFCHGNFLGYEKKPILKNLPINIVVGLIASVVYLNINLAEIFDGKLKTFNRLTSNILNFNQNYNDSRDKYFSKENFYINGARSEDFQNKFLKEFPINKKNDVYVLGDDSYLYIALDQNFPPHINFYNQSIIALQKETIDWITKNDPKYVIWDANFKDFDFVPNILRVPLIFNFIQERYRPESTIDKFQVLVRNHDSAVRFSDLKFWSAHLGTDINFRNLTRLSNLNKEVSCKNKTNAPQENSTFLLISAPKIHLPNEVKVNFKTPGSLFTISFIAGNQSHSGDYVIPLSSIWFYKFLYRESALKIISPDDGIDIKFCNDAANSNVLY